MDQAPLIYEAAGALKRALASQSTPLRAFVGLDGFIDEIVKIVDERKDFTTYTPVRTISDYAGRLAMAAGKSTNVEFVLQQTKMGGNGPLMTDALGRLGARVDYIGALGFPELHPVFEPLRQYGNVLSIANPGVTVAAEFEDGKIMHGRLESLLDITYSAMVERLGGEPELDRLLGGADLVGMVNWTMIPHMTEVWKGLSDHLRQLGIPGPRFYFFDLCDPQKRTREDLRRAMATIASFNRMDGTPILGLNDKESEEVCDAIGIDYGQSGIAGLVDRAKRISQKTGIPEIVIHPRDCAGAVGPKGQGVVRGPLCANPKLTTGAGDHFNGGYCFARLMGLGPNHALVIGKAVSGFYVREGLGPSAPEVLDFCERWVAGALDS